MKRYVSKKDRDDAKILRELMETKWDNNQIRIVELLQEMNETSDKITKDVLELKKTLKANEEPK